MKRTTLALQVSLALALVLLGLCWHRLRVDCGGSDCADGDVFVDAVRRPSPTPENVPEESKLAVEYGGCAMIATTTDHEIECIYEPGQELRLWVTYAGIDDVHLEIDGQPWSATPYEKPEEPGRGYRGALIADDARQLLVRAPGEAPWLLRLRSSTRLTTRERRVLERLDERVTALENPLILGQVDVLREVRRLMDELRVRGLLSNSVDLALAASYHLVWRSGRLDLAEELLEHVRPSAERYPEGSAAWAIYHGHVLAQRGQLVEAAKAYRDGGRYAVRVGDAGLQIDALSAYALALAELGYFEAALRWGSQAIDQARAEGRLADQVAVMTTVARMSLQLREAGRTDQDPGPLLRETLELAAAAPDDVDTGEVEPARLWLAKLAFVDGDPGLALDHLRDLDPSRLSHDELVEAQDVRLVASIARGASAVEIEAELARLEDLAARVTSPGATWLATVRRGQVLERHGDLDGAEEAYEHGEDLLDDLIPLSFLGVQAEVAPARRLEGTQRLVSLLLRRGRPEQAFCVLRQAQTRLGQLARLFPRLDPKAQETLRPIVEEYFSAKRDQEALLRNAEERSTENRERARLEAARRQEELLRHALDILVTQGDYRARPSCEELSPRQEGELLLGLYPHHDRLLVLVQDDEGTTYRRLSNYRALTDSDDARWLGHVLLDPLEARLARAKRVRVLASGEAAAIDVHALPFGERLLVEQIPVVYGLDLPPLAPRGYSSGRIDALVLEDELAEGTEAEASAVQAALEVGGTAVQRVRSGEWTADRLRKALSEVDHFHYAGHAYHGAGALRRPLHIVGKEDGLSHRWPPYPGGAAAEPSYIPLGRAERLDVQDILMMEEVPRTVVLMGCTTAARDERFAYGGFSLATAFLGAGAEAVVASTREIDGVEASLVGQGLYTEVGGRWLAEPGSWFMHAIQRARRAGLPEGAVRDYRVLVP